jgi:hypothetical protein
VCVCVCVCVFECECVYHHIMRNSSAPSRMLNLSMSDRECGCSQAVIKRQSLLTGVSEIQVYVDDDYLGTAHAAA